MVWDLRIDVAMQIAEGDLVLNRCTSLGSDPLGYLGMPLRGGAIRTPAIQIFRIVDGKIVESWAVRGDAGTLRQLGASRYRRRRRETLPEDG
jgi:predicted ester cyclase